MLKPVLCVLVAGACLVGGCRTDAETPTGELAPRAFEAPRTLNVALHRGVASTMAFSESGEAVHAWVTLAADQKTGRLFVMAGGRAPREIDDPDAIPVLDPETPPQIEYGSDGSLSLTYAASSDLENKWSSMAIRFTRSTDGGATWSDPVSVGAGAPFGGYRNDHEMHVARDGAVYVAWLDSRYAPEDASAIHVLLSRSDDGGATWAAPVRIDAEPSCECCRVALASDADGAVYAAWRKILPGGIRDVVVARSADRGATWRAPVRVYADDWEMSYCPDAGPALHLDDEGRLHVAWWSGREGDAGVRYARSSDRGVTFGDPVRLKVGALSKAAHVQLALDGEGQVAVVWDDGTLQTPRIALRTSSDGGASFGPLTYLSPSGPAATYPVVAFADEALTVVWHERGEGENAARMRKAEEGVWAAYTEGETPQLVARRRTLP